MEFLMVGAKQRGTNRPLEMGLTVLINGEKNGITGSPIKLDTGVIQVSVNYLLSETVEVNLMNTTPKNPKVVTVMVGKEQTPAPVHPAPAPQV